MTVDFDSLVRRPFRSADWWRTNLVGALLLATAPLAIPSVLLAGYGIRILRIDDDDPLPTFADLRSLAETGVRATVVGLAYHLPGLALVLWGGVAVLSAVPHVAAVEATRPETLAAVGATTPTMSGLQATLSTAAALLGAATLPVSSYLATLALTEYAATDDLAAAFDVGRLRERALSVATLRAWLLVSLVGVGSWIVSVAVSGVAATVPGVGAVVAGGVHFYGGVVGLLIWDAARPTDDGETRPDGTASASRATAT